MLKVTSNKKTTRQTQIGGTQYKVFEVEPVDFITKNQLDWLSGHIVKYVCRHKLKGGAVDIKKAIHYAQMLLEDVYGVASEVKYTDSQEEVPTVKKRKKRKKNGNLPAETGTSPTEPTAAPES
jgi:hypothetical protein